MLCCRIVGGDGKCVVLPLVFSCSLITILPDPGDRKPSHSDHQGGKGVADRISGSVTCKNHLWFYINEGNDVTTADQMKAALLSHGGVNGVRVTVVKGQT